MSTASSTTGTEFVIKLSKKQEKARRQIERELAEQAAAQWASVVGVAVADAPHPMMSASLYIGLPSSATHESRRTIHPLAAAFSEKLRVTVLADVLNAFDIECDDDLCKNLNFTTLHSYMDDHRWHAATPVHSLSRILNGLPQSERL
jgi:hypothetical protein